jgi:flagellar basal-body rod modification protein FlgD
VTDVIPISTVTEAANAKPAAPQPRNTLDKDAFLRLLVAQLKYQNPLDPADPNEFMAQTAQFTMVEKLQAMADDAAAQRAITESMTATSLLGRHITWIDADGVEHSGVVTGTAFGTAGASVLVGDVKVPLGRVSGVQATEAPPAGTADPEQTAPTDSTESAESTEPTQPTDQEA